MSLKGGIFKKVVKTVQPAAPALDLLLSPFTLLAIVWFRIIRYWGIKNLRISQSLFINLGMLPVVDHYYEPLIDYRKLPKLVPKSHLCLDGMKQRDFIAPFNFQEELKSIPIEGKDYSNYYYHNGSFGSGDSELYYSIIRHYKPSRILEVGSGFSTLLAIQAIRKTKEIHPDYFCEMTCIEPFEMPFLDFLDVKLIRQRVEQVDKKFFLSLQRGDILFIDSSHVIRPGGDVTFLILETLSELSAGVLIHFHDIFIPNHYPKEWLRDEYRLWNEQYLLEAFLLHNDSFEVVFSFGFMMQQEGLVIEEKFPVLKTESGRQAGSIWLRKIR